MNAVAGFLRKRLLGISPAETTFARRGFRGRDAAARARLEGIGRAFMQGYQLALEEDQIEILGQRLNQIDGDQRGFSFEGASMALALLDRLTPWRHNRIQRFLRGPGEPHTYMVHVGVGWSWARLPLNIQRARAQLEPLLGWLALDGYGFHEAFFHWRRYLPEHLAPRRLIGYERRVFDQGFGRCLWFIEGGDVEAIPKTVAGFALERRSDLWSGVGLAATYAGGVSRPALEALKAAAGAFQPALAQGAAFAAKARERAGILTVHTRMAAHVFCGLPADKAARLTDAALENLPDDPCQPAFESWRQRLQTHFAHPATGNQEMRPPRRSL